MGREGSEYSVDWTGMDWTDSFARGRGTQAK